jgi:hypothetical protein
MAIACRALSKIIPARLNLAARVGEVAERQPTQLWHRQWAQAELRQNDLSAEWRARKNLTKLSVTDSMDGGGLRSQVRFTTGLPGGCWKGGVARAPPFFWCTLLTVLSARA